MKKNVQQILIEDSKDQNKLGSITPPIYQTSLFSYPDYESFSHAMRNEKDSFIYTRGNNPTVREVEKKLADLEGGEDARILASGISAISAAAMSLLRQGDHVICVSNCYDWTKYLFNTYLARFGVEVTFVDGTQIESFEKALQPKTKLIYLESPTSLTFSLQDLTAVGILARKKNIYTIIDNTWATPLFQNPLDYGIDLVVHSLSKYIGGHSDVVGGAVIGSQKLISQIFETELLALGHIAAPISAWLFMRGLRTLEIRLKRHEASTLRIAEFLESHSKVNTVLYPPLSSHPQHLLFKRQMSGSNGLLSFTLRDSSIEKIRTFTNTLKLFRIGVSWGGFESLVFPASIKLDPSNQQVLGNNKLIRLHIGLDDVNLLQDDLQNALNTL